MKLGFLTSCGGFLAGALDSRVAKALAFREALSSLKKLNNQNVYIELDNLNVVECVGCGSMYFLVVNLCLT